jgi:hypothetical protein
MWIHGLSDNHGHIFINKESSEKLKNSGQLSQEAIDRAFRSHSINSPENTDLGPLGAKRFGLVIRGFSAATALADTHVPKYEPFCHQRKLFHIPKLSRPTRFSHHLLQKVIAKESREQIDSPMRLAAAI